MPVELPDLLVADAAELRHWLDTHEADTTGVWLVLAKKGPKPPTSLTYDQALLEALCSGWIDGQSRRRDDSSYFIRFTPRRSRSIWSQRNVGLVADLIDQGRMRPAGLAQVEAARSDGRWDAAYAGAASIEVPDDLTAALAAEPAALTLFGRLNAQNRYAVLHRVATARTPQTRAARIERLVGQLAAGQTPHPQRQPPAGAADG